MNNFDLNAIFSALQPMRNNRLRNYILPGLTSHLIGGGEYGKVRLFSAERESLEFVTPHSHRFDFTCLVLKGQVWNTLFFAGEAHHETWCRSSITQVCGLDGVQDYKHVREDKPCHVQTRTDHWKAGDVYSMDKTAIHSIKFDREARVLFFEGPQVTQTSHMLEPWIDGKVIPTFRVEPWMFQKDDRPRDWLAQAQVVS